MTQQWWDKINGVGITFRFITPILIGSIGYLLNLGILDIKQQITALDTHFTNHLQHHQELEVGYERRMAITETEIKILLQHDATIKTIQDTRAEDNRRSMVIDLQKEITR